jgi:pimeloyl-ACP methyl ester carboxylesterase
MKFEDLSFSVVVGSVLRDLALIRRSNPATGRYVTLKSFTHPTLIVHGNKDIVVTPINAFILAEHLPNAQLIMYADSSHGAFYQHRKAFLEHVKIFLSDGDSAVSELDSIKSSVS